MHTIEWAAGLFEGEGCMYGRVLRLKMSDLDVVENFQEVVGCGTINQEHWKPHAHYKTLFYWQVGSRKAVIKVLTMLLPYLGLRRAYEALNILDDLELAT